MYAALNLPNAVNVMNYPEGGYFTIITSTLYIILLIILLLTKEINILTQNID